MTQEVLSKVEYFLSSDIQTSIKDVTDKKSTEHLVQRLPPEMNEISEITPLAILERCINPYNPVLDHRSDTEGNYRVNETHTSWCRVTGALSDFLCA